MIRKTWIAGALALALGIGEAQGAVRLDAEAQAHLGVRTARLEAARRAGEVDAFAKVLDPGPLAQLVSDLESAEAASAASGAEARRLHGLHASGDGVSAKDVEAAEAQARSDAVRKALLRHRLGLEWGPGVAAMPRARLDQLVDRLAAGKAALVHVDTHNNDGQAGARTVRIDVGADSVRGAVIGPARVAESRLQSSGLIVEVAGPQAILMSVGLTQSAHIETTDPHVGVIAPRAAILRFRGADWVFVRTGSDKGAAAFERRLVSGIAPDARGLFIAQGLSPADEVVVDGASALFAAEQNAAPGGR